MFGEIMYILPYDLFEKGDKYYLKLEIRIVCREFSAFKYVFIFFFQNKSDDYLYLYIRNLENSRLKPVSRYTISMSICIGR